MSDMQRLEARLRAFAAAPDGAPDWEEVLRRAGRGRRVSRRRVAFALAACVAIAAPSLVFVGLHGGGGHRKVGSSGLDAPSNDLSIVSTAAAEG
jgi:hypothetical protein